MYKYNVFYVEWNELKLAKLTQHISPLTEIQETIHEEITLTYVLHSIVVGFRFNVLAVTCCCGCSDGASGWRCWRLLTSICNGSSRLISGQHFLVWILLFSWLRRLRSRRCRRQIVEELRQWISLYLTEGVDGEWKQRNDEALNAYPSRIRRWSGGRSDFLLGLL